VRAVIFAVAACLGALGLATPASATITTSITNGTAKVTGDGASDKIAVGVASATAIGIDIGADGTFDTGFELFDFSNLEIDMGGGDDTVDLSPLISTFGQIRPTVVDGGDGNDQLIGSNGPETLQGGAGNDSIDPKMGPDTASGGPGDDTFLWVPGDGNDKIDGDDGADTLSFSGSDANEALTVRPNGDRVTLRRDVDSVSMDLGSLEQLSLPSLGGNDSVIAANGIAPLELDVAAGAGDDVFSGGDEIDHFDGGPGQDAANAGAGAGLRRRRSSSRARA
jgi:Ca2+-binding RTX toxin-like protein